MTKRTKKKSVAKKGAKPVAKVKAALPARVSQLSIDELRAAYQTVVGRDTGSDNRSYLMWKIREAEKGRVRVGPSLKREASGPQRVFSLRVDADAVPLLDAAWKKHGMKSRMDLVRRALYRELDALGEREAAARFEPGDDRGA